MSTPAGTPQKRAVHARSNSADSDEPTQQHSSAASTPQRTRIDSRLFSVPCIHLEVAASQEEQQEGRQDSWLDRFTDACLRDVDEMAICIHAWLTPARTGHHWVMFSPVLITILLLAFVFAAAQYPYWTTWHNWQDCIAQARVGTDCAAGALLPTNSTGLGNIAEWTSLEFSVQYLRDLGAFDAQDIADGQAHRWLTSQGVHGTVGHLVGNMVMLVMLAVPLERRLGWWRVLITWCTSVLAGNMWALALEDPCVLVVGASGGVCGLLGLFICDAVLDRRHMPLIRLVMLFSIFMTLILSTVTQGWQVSQFSHLGGIVCGCLCGLLFAHGHNHYKRFMWVAGASCLSLMLGLLLIWSYVGVLPNLHCD